MRDSPGLRLLSRLWQRGAVAAGRHRVCRALAARIYASRGVLGMFLSACGMFCQLQGARVCVREAGTARGWGRRHGCGGYAPHGGVVTVGVECLGPTWEGSEQSEVKSIIIVLQYCSIAIE